MNTSQLAAKQKRAHDWGLAISDLIQDPEVKARMKSDLDTYRRLIASCWKASAISQADLIQFADLERRLNSLNEEGRLKVVGGGYRSMHMNHL